MGRLARQGVAVVATSLLLTGMFAVGDDKFGPLGPERAEAASLTACMTAIRTMAPATKFGVYGTLAAAATAGPVCGGWVGTLNARAICYASRQWWGGFARSVVRFLTYGRYDRC